jgi:peptide/nickel transport system permease protein
MKHTFQQIFHSGKFVVGFCIFMAMLLFVLIYPLIVHDAPLGIIAQGTFFPPGIYVNTYDTIHSPTTYILNLNDAATKRIENKLSNDDRIAIKEWLVADGIPADQIDISDTADLLGQWETNFDPNKSVPGMTFAKQRFYQRLDISLKGLLSTEAAIIAETNPQTGTVQQSGLVNQTDYVNINDVANVRILPLGTDNFGRDILTELVKATAVSLQDRKSVV